LSNTTAECLRTDCDVLGDKKVKLGLQEYQKMLFLGATPPITYCVVFEGTLNMQLPKTFIVFGSKMWKQEELEDTAGMVTDIQMSIHVCAIVNRVSGKWTEGRTDGRTMKN
jgi:hypothetical protein